MQAAQRLTQRNGGKFFFFFFYFPLRFLFISPSLCRGAAVILDAPVVIYLHVRKYVLCPQQTDNYTVK